MADNTEELGIRIRTDGAVEATNGVNLSGQAVENLAKKLDAAGKPLKEGDTGLKNLGSSARQTQQAFRMLPAQITDIATSLASGSPVWLVAIQQGGQIKDSFGGVGPMFREITAALGPARLAAGGTAAAVALLVVAHQQGRREAQGYAQALILNANAAGTYADAMADMARANAAVVGTQGKAAESITAMAATGEVAARDLQKLGLVGQQLERELGQPLEQTAQRFQELGRAPLEASLRLNRGVNYLTASVRENIRALMAQGKEAEAASLAQNAYADAMSGRAKRVSENLGLLEKAWRGVGDGAKWSWDQMLDIGRAETLDQKIARLRKELAKADEPFDASVFNGNAEAKAKRKENIAQLAAALEVQRLANRSAYQEAQAAQQNEQELSKQNAAFIEASNAVALAKARAAATGREGVLAAETATLEELRDRDLVSAAAYYERKAALDVKGLRSRMAVVDAEIAAARAAKPESQEGGLQQQAKLLDLGAQRKELATQVTAAEVAGERAATAARADSLTAFQADLAQRRQSLAQFSDQMRIGNDRMAVDLIANPFKRATAMARLDIEELKRATADQVGGLTARLPILDVVDPQQAEDVRAQILQIEQRKADGIVLINRKLTEDLKPEWQKMLEGWQDVNLKMEETSRQFHDGWLREGEATFVRFVQTGKLNIGSLKDFVLQQYAQMVWRDNFRPAFASAGSWVASLFGFHSGGVGQSEASFTRPVMASLPRFHSGIGPDEVPAVIQRTEGVFTKGQMAAMAPVDKLAKAVGGPQINFAPVINVDSRTDRAEVVALVDRSMRGAQAQLLEMMNRGLV